MAEETVVKELLTSEMITGGEKLTSLLDSTDFKVIASLWLYSSDENEWLLILASPQVDSRGPKKAYTKIQAALSGSNISGVDLQNITVRSPKDPLIKLLRVAVRTDNGISGIRFTRNRINDALIEDAYIYRLL